ncbi:MAG: rod shape-determining protein MreD [Candidatus Melainabacteria bacterium]|nr:rod shape-determining protein MreD [Candidatus Melainabacteria bacterium]
MALLSMRARKKVFNIGLTAVVGSVAWLLQLTVLNNFSFEGAICNLPLTLTILWGSVFGSPLPPLRGDDLKVSTIGEVFLYQAASGSVSGALVGALLGAVYASVLPVYPLCFPIIGWLAGYFCLRNLNQETLVCIPLVLLASVAAESIMAFQLFLHGRPDVFPHLASIALPEAVLNALIAPFVYFPMRHWYDFSHSYESQV